MRHLILFFFGILVMTVACKDSAPELCEPLREDLLNLNVPDVKDHLNEWLAGLQPDPNNEDPTGHRNNLAYFVNRLNEECDLDASMDCYACIETFPPQSEVIVHIKALGGNVQRVLDIRTPDSDILTVVNVHE